MTNDSNVDPSTNITTGQKVRACVAICIVHFCLMGTINITGGLGGRIVTEFGLNAADLGGLMSVSFLTGAIFGIPLGIFADKTKVTTAITAGLIVATLGAVLRAVTYPMGVYPLLYLSNFIIGFGLAGLNANSIKFLAAWWGNKLSTAMGFYVAMAGFGTVTAIQSIQFFGETLNCWWAVGVACIVGTILWILLARMPEGVVVQKDNIRVADFVAVAKQPLVWIAILALTFPMSANVVFGSMLSSILIDGKGMTEVAANNVVSVAGIAFMIGCAFVPMLLERLGALRSGIIGCAAVVAIVSVVGWLIPDVNISAYSLALVGIFTGGCIPIAKSLVGLLKSINEHPEVLGSVGGLQCLVQNLGTYLIPIGIGACVTYDAAGVANYLPLWIATSACFVATIIVTLMIPKSALVTVDKDAE